MGFRPAGYGGNTGSGVGEEGTVVRLGKGGLGGADDKIIEIQPVYRHFGYGTGSGGCGGTINPAFFLRNQVRLNFSGKVVYIPSRPVGDDIYNIFYGINFVAIPPMGIFRRSGVVSAAVVKNRGILGIYGLVIV